MKTVDAVRMYCPLNHSKCYTSECMFWEDEPNYQPYNRNYQPEGNCLVDSALYYIPHALCDIAIELRKIREKQDQ